jgi:polyphosphate kinase
MMPQLNKAIPQIKLKHLASAPSLDEPQYKPNQPNQPQDEPHCYFNRELSWLEFNDRILCEALDARTPLLERLKFMAIVSSNLDEFFMVRVATLKQQVEAQVSQLSEDGQTPQQQLDAISHRLRPMVALQHQQFQDMIRPELAKKGVHLLDYANLNHEQQHYLHHYFEAQIFPILTPMAIDPGRPFPYISNRSLNLAVVVQDADTQQTHLARIKVPSGLPRFIALPQTLYKRQRGRATLWTGVPIEQVIAHNLEPLFPGMTILAYYLFRVTRDADLELAEHEADDLLLAIEQELRKRRLGGIVVRMELQASTPDDVREILMQELDLTDQDVYEIEGLFALNDVASLTSLPLPKLKDPSWVPIVPSRLRRAYELATHELPADGSDDPDERDDLFAVIRRGDLLVHHPYYAFSASVLLFITQAARDPDVLAIKMTLYRTTHDSPILNALIAAAENGKQVAVVVELKARFDEQNNINWARKLENAGIHVVYGLTGLKTHTKVALVVRRESAGASPEDIRIRRYVHIGTGNYNTKTARLYTDLGLLSCREDLGADLSDLFNYLTGCSRQRAYRKLLVAPVNLRDRILALIRREIDHRKTGHPGRIVAKLNALVDPQIIQALYRASQAGVQIDLIVRGICCLRPGVAGMSENIRVISIVGRYLEHSRIFYFHNKGNEEVFIGSADWRSRNLDRRVEVIAPIEDADISKDLQEILGTMLADNRHAWELMPDGRYKQRHPDLKERERDSQTILMQMAAQGAGPGEGFGP